MQFKEVVGHSELKKKLIQTVRENRISHAQLFLGAEGTGNLALAIAYGQYISCTDKGEEDSCGKCPSCVKYNKLVHPDLHFAFPVATNKKVTSDPVSDKFVNEWRDFVRKNPYAGINDWYDRLGLENKQGAILKNESYAIVRKLILKSYEAEYKVMIIWMAEKMNDSAANKLLKMIEEPPPKTLFFLVTSDDKQIIQTIRSRTQLVKIPSIDKDSLAKAIVDKYSIDQQQVIDIVRLANGSFLKAQEVLEYNEDRNRNFALFIEWMRLCYSRKIVNLMEWVESIASCGREKQKRFITFALRMLRECFILNIAPQQANQLVYLTADEMEFSRKFSPFITERNIYLLSEELNKAYIHIERNASNKLVFLDLSLHVVKLLNQKINK